MNKTTILLVIAIVLSVTVCAGVQLGPIINTVTVSELDKYYSPCTGNNIAHITANVSNAVFVSANFSTIDAGIDCGSGNTVILTNTAANTWTGQCDLTAEAQNSNFNLAGPVIIAAADSGGHTDIDTSLTIILYNMTTPSMPEGCDRFGDETTNMCEVDDFSNVNFVTEIQTNGTCMSDQTGQQLPWTDYKTVAKFDFASIDMTGNGIGGRLAGLGNALQVYVTPPGQFGDSHISVNTSAFAELDTQATVSVYGLPFTEEPAIYGEGDSISNVQYTFNEPYVIIMSEEDCDEICDEECSDDKECYDECMSICTATIVSIVPNADLTFTVGGFSQYNMTDEVQPTVTINSPEDQSTTQESITISATIDGTGSQISNVEFLINDETACTYDQNEVYENCVNETADWGIITCECNVKGLSEGENTIQVFGTDFGGEEGYTGSNTATITVDILGCGDTIESDATLTSNLECDGGDGIIFGADGITLDCAGNAISGSGSNGVKLNSISGATVKNCDISGFNRGIYVTGSSNNNKITDNYVHDNNQHNIDVRFGPDNTTISNNNASNCGVGINIKSSTNNVIRNNNASYNSNAGIRISEGTGNQVYDNTVAYNTDGIGNGIDLGSTSDNTIRDNTLESNTVGIFTANSENNVIHGNTVIDSQTTGIHLYDTSNTNVTNNTVTDSVINGIYLQSQSMANSYNLVQDNTITVPANTQDGYNQFGIKIEDDNNEIYDNTITCTNSEQEQSGIWIHGSDVNAEDNTLSGNEVSGCDYGLSAWSVQYFEVDSDNYHDNDYYGIYLQNTGGDGTSPLISNVDVVNNMDGIYMQRSEATIINTTFTNNLGREGRPESGLHIDGSSTAYVTNGEFTGNAQYAIYDEGPRYVHWTIDGNAVCRNNDVRIVGDITFDGGTLQMDNCTLNILSTETWEWTTIEKDGTINSLEIVKQAVTSNTSTDFNFSESAVELTLSSDVTTTMAITGETPGSAPSGFTAFKGIDIIVDSTTDGALTSALIKIYYTHAELTAANLAESSLKIYYYNITSGAWQYEADQGVDAVNDYIWVRVTHFSQFGTFGAAPSGGYSGGGGGGGGSGYYKQNSLTGTVGLSVDSCYDDWMCDSWSECKDGTKTRECVLNDYENCDKQSAKPATTTKCTIETPQTTQEETQSVKTVPPETPAQKSQALTGAFMQNLSDKVPKTAAITALAFMLIGGILIYYFFVRK